MKAKPIEQRGYYLAAATWQDTLLQSYRTFHVTIQGFLVAAGVTVLSVQLTGAVQSVTPERIENAKLIADVVFNGLFTGLIALLFWLQHRLTVELSGIVANRAQDIDYWHKLTMLVENDFDVDQRAFTYFKMWQQAKRSSVEHLLPKYLPDEGISPEAAAELIGKGLGHTRQVLDVNLFRRLQILWRAILGTSTVIGIWFLWQYFQP